uniref:hypothetical protein n=1 Tax=Peptoniphilus grossensis TaxID=1465756 RepID=UPI00288A1B37|nr:hypothetical protein [Peptoniphilus grossensis]
MKIMRKTFAGTLTVIIMIFILSSAVFATELAMSSIQNLMTLTKTQATLSLAILLIRSLLIILASRTSRLSPGT